MTYSMAPGWLIIPAVSNIPFEAIATRELELVSADGKSTSVIRNAGQTCTSLTGLDLLVPYRGVRSNC